MVHYFTETFGAGTRSIVRNKALVRKMAVPREMFPVASMLVSAYNVLPGLVLLTGCCLFLGWHPDPVGMAAAVLGFLLVAILGTALALLFSAANVFFRDFSNVVSTLTQFINFSVPMIYPYSKVQDRFGEYAHFYLANPIAEAVLLIQRAFWVGTTSHPKLTIAEGMPPNLFQLAFIHIALALRVPGPGAAGVHATREQDPGASLMTESIVVETSPSPSRSATTGPSRRCRWPRCAGSS